MNKAERINDLILYLNNKNNFNLKDIMDKYNISKSTAIRDILSLEQIGMPIYSELGRNGGYGILKNRLLSPIIFTIDEMYSLYFTMITLGAYKSTPFNLEISKLKQKFESCLSEKQLTGIRKIENILTFETTEHLNSSPFLIDILKYAVEEKVCFIHYSKSNNLKKYYVQFFNISSKYGQWYTSAFDFRTKKLKVFRCDKIISIKENNDYISKDLEEMNSSTIKTHKTKTSIDFKVQIHSSAIDLFTKENYPSMKLHFENNMYFIKGYYNKNEEDFISSYFLNYGTSIISIEPKELKTLITNKISILKHYYSSI